MKEGIYDNTHTKHTLGLYIEISAVLLYYTDVLLDGTKLVSLYRKFNFIPVPLVTTKILQIAPFYTHLKTSLFFVHLQIQYFL